MKFDRNLIVFIGPSAAGKTEGMNQVRTFLGENDIPYYENSISDSRYILEQIQLDDLETGGQNHFHSWCEGVTTGHSHEGSKPDLKFTVTGQSIPQGMYTAFTRDLAKPRSHDKLWLVEWSGGGSVNPFGDATYSFARMREQFEKGIYDSSWFQRVLAIIHPWVPDFESRIHLNGLRTIPSETERTKGTGSWPLPESAMKLFQYDDFEGGLRPYLEEHGLTGRIHTVANRGENELVENKIGYHVRLNQAFREIFSPWIRGEGHQVRIEAQKKGARKEL